MLQILKLVKRPLDPAPQGFNYVRVKFVLLAELQIKGKYLFGFLERIIALVDINHHLILVLQLHSNCQNWFNTAVTRSYLQ